MTAKMQAYMVQGKWPFPFDMLRHDQARAASADDQLLIMALSEDYSTAARGLHNICLELPYGVRPNVARWESFDWKVVQGPIVVREPRAAPSTMLEGAEARQTYDAAHKSISDRYTKAIQDEHDRHQRALKQIGVNIAATFQELNVLHNREIKVS